jgi:hypothetical protein
VSTVRDKITELLERRAKLVEDKQRCEAEQAKIRAELGRVHGICMTRKDGKREYFAERAIQEGRRADLTAEKTEIEVQLRVVQGELRRLSEEEHKDYIASVAAPKNVVDESWRLLRWAAQIIGDDDWQAAYVELQRWGTPRA